MATDPTTAAREIRSQLTELRGPGGPTAAFGLDEEALLVLADVGTAHADPGHSIRLLEGLTFLAPAEPRIHSALAAAYRRGSDPRAADAVAVWVDHLAEGGG